MNAIDTNVLIYSVDATDPRKHAQAASFLDSLTVADTIIPWQVACEIASVLRLKQREGTFVGDYEKTLRTLRAYFPVQLPSLSVLERSVAIQQRDQVSVWDALLIAACAEAGVTTLYTEDLQSKPIIAGVKVVNPFA